MNMVKRKEITMYSHECIWQYAADELNMERTYYMCKQKDVLMKAVGLWGSTFEKAMKDFQNDDYIRMVGIQLHESFWDRLDVIQDNKKLEKSLMTKLLWARKPILKQQQVISEIGQSWLVVQINGVMLVRNMVIESWGQTMQNT